MPIEYQDATAVVWMTGLGIIGLNKELNRSETLMIHDMDHKPRLRVLRPGPEDPMITDLPPISGYQVWIDHQDLPKNGLNKETTGPEPLIISVKGVGNGGPNGVSRYYGDTFERPLAVGNDPNDWRWIPDLERDDLLGQGTKQRRPTELGIETSRVFFENCLMFTHDLVTEHEKAFVDNTTVQDFFKRTLTFGNEGKPKIQTSPFGAMADYVGAKFDSELVEITITAGSVRYQHLLSRSASPHVIVINNADREQVTVSDMRIYQSFWDADPEMVDLEIVSELEKTHKKHGLKFNLKGGDAHGVRRTCNLISVEGGIGDFVV